MRPELFRPWETVRPEGYTLDQAAFALVPAICRSQVSRLLAGVEAGVWGAEEYVRHRAAFWSHVLERLKRSELLMQGRVLGSGKAWTASTDLFDRADPDFDRNQITLCGQTFACIRVSVQIVKPLSNTVSTAEQAMVWMSNNVAHYRAKQRDDRVAQCRLELGVSRQVARAAWDALPASIKGHSRKAGPLR